MQRYRVTTPFVAVKPDDDGHYRFVTLGRGSVFDLNGELRRTELVEILFEGRVLAAFIRDIEERAERIFDGAT